MSETSRYSIDTAGLARVSGPMTLKTVSHLYQQAAIENVRGRRMVGLDLGEVPSVDSSGLALLLEWQSESLKAGNSLQVRNAPPDLLSLVSLCEAGDLLIIEGRNQSESARATH